MKFWAEIEVPDDEVEETEDPTLYDVAIDALDVIGDNGASRIRFKVLRFVEDEPREERE